MKLLLGIVLVVGALAAPIQQAQQDQCPERSARFEQLGTVSINGVVAYGWVDGIGLFSIGPAEWSSSDAVFPDQQPGSITIKYIDDHGNEIVVFMGCNGFLTFLACSEAAKRLLLDTQKQFPPAAPTSRPAKSEQDK